MFTGVIDMSISDAEAVVMEILWSEHPLAAEDVVARLSGQSDWAEPTIKTLLNRLLKKRAVRAERDGRRYRYSPVLTRDAWVASQSEGVLDRLSGGRVAPLVAHLRERGTPSQQDLEGPRRLSVERE